MKPDSTALVFSTDETFAPLAKGLVLSVLPNTDEFDLFMIDIGCSEMTLAWMRERNVKIVRFDRTKHLRKPPRVALKPYQDAQLCRPFLPSLIDGYQIYLWCDSDIWIQDVASLRIYRDAVIERPGIVPISPLVDTSYSYFYSDMSEFTRYSQYWYAESFGPTVAKTYADRAVLSSGLFAMNRDNPLWKSWASEIENILQRQIANHDALHLSEQVALNYLLYAGGKFLPVEAIHNYNCHIGKLRRTAGGAIVIDQFPYRQVGAVHLSFSSKMIGRYIDQGLLFDSGRYLGEHELNELRKLSHY